MNPPEFHRVGIVAKVASRDAVHIAHELSEAVTDPDLNAWFDDTGMENADKCAFTFGHVELAPNGSGTNVHWGSRDFLIQQNWVNAGGGSCAVAYP